MYGLWKIMIVSLTMYVLWDVILVTRDLISKTVTRRLDLHLRHAILVSSPLSVRDDDVHAHNVNILSKCNIFHEKLPCTYSFESAMPLFLKATPRIQYKVSKANHANPQTRSPASCFKSYKNNKYNFIRRLKMTLIRRDKLNN